MSYKRIAQTAIELVRAWDSQSPDESLRGRLIDFVRDHLSPRRRPTECKVHQGREQRQFGGGHFILPAIAEQLVQCLKMGLSHRQVVKECGVSKNTVGRYERLNGPFVCPCGQPRTHRGWCSERLKHSPLRRDFLRTWMARQLAAGTRRKAAPRILVERRVITANWPYLTGKPGDGAILIDAVNAIVPKTFPDHQRADICQDLLLAVLEGEATIEKLRDGSAAAIMRYYKLHPGKFGPVSLDAPIPGTNGLTIGDTIRDDATHF